MKGWAGKKVTIVGCRNVAVAQRPQKKLYSDARAPTGSGFRFQVGQEVACGRWFEAIAIPVARGRFCGAFESRR